ncbi:MAG TPA: tetratricopeptide repeat protein [Bryobacteraceae bacterium]|nr:tetratricopeptide repeat protein [Bryobacteraceae bacterium]
MVPVLSLLAASVLAFQAGVPSGTPTAQGLRAADTAPPAVAQPKPDLSPETRGDIMMARKMYREAVEFYKQGADKNAVLANKTGIAYHQQLDLPDAKKWYERSIKLNPKYAEAINNLGTVYYAQKSYRRAISQYRRALLITPNSASFLSNLGTAYFARKQYDEAFQFYDQALALDPEVFEHRGTQGTILQERTVEEKARFHYALAKSYAKAGATERALQYIRMSVEEGFKDKEKFLKDPEFAALQENEEFKKIMTAEQKVL